MNSREKGKRGEREFAAFLRELGLAARRGQQFCGSPESPDVICPALPWLHLEVKRCERLDIRDWVPKAIADAQGKDWEIHFRWNNGPWLCVSLSEYQFRKTRGGASRTGV